MAKRQEIFTLTWPNFVHSFRGINLVQPWDYFRFCVCDSMVVCLNKWQMTWLLPGRPAYCQVPAYLNTIFTLSVITNIFAYTYKPFTWNILDFQFSDNCLCLDVVWVSNWSLRNPEFTADKIWIILSSIQLWDCLTFFCV